MSRARATRRDMSLHQRLDNLLGRLDDVELDEDVDLNYLMNTQDDHNVDLDLDVEIPNSPEPETLEEPIEDTRSDPESPISQPPEPKTPEPKVPIAPKHVKQPRSRSTKPDLTNVREDQNLRRQIGEINAITRRNKTVESFIAELDSDNDEENAQPAEKTLLSSPPPMRGLVSFVHNGDSDSDLEIVPETTRNRMTKPARDMLRLAGNANITVTRELNGMRQKLKHLQTEQIKQRKEARRKELEQVGVDIAALERQIETERAKTGGAEAWLQLERERAKNFEEEVEGEAEEETDDEDGQLELSRAPKLVSDSEDDELIVEPKEASLTEAPKAGPSGTQYVAPISEALIAGILDEDSGTQPVEPVSESVLAKELGMETEDDEVVSEIESFGEIEGESGPELDAPDVSDVKGTLSERLAEVRKRYLARKAEERRLEELEAHEKRMKEQQAAERRVLLEEEADESDEEGGIVERNDNEDEGIDAELAELVNHGKVNIREAEVRKKFAEEERKRDEQLLGRLVRGVKGGGFTRAQAQKNGLFLDDDGENEGGEDLVSEALRAASAHRRQQLINSNAKTAKLANNSRACAFFASISEDLTARPGSKPKSSFEESLQYLRSVECETGSSKPAGYHQTIPINVEEDNSEIRHQIKSVVRRTSTIRTAARQNTGSTTYAASISSTDIGTKTVDIMQSLGRSSGLAQGKPSLKKQFLAAAQKPTAKKQRVSGTTPANAVFVRRKWA